jgi:hypothetical protein
VVELCCEVAIGHYPRFDPAEAAALPFVVRSGCR